MSEPEGVLYRDQNTGAERRSTTRLHYPYVLVGEEEKPKSGNGRRKRKVEEEQEQESET